MPSVDTILIPLFGAILVGIIAGWRGIFSQDDARMFSKFVFTLGMPIAVFNFMRQSDPPEAAFAGMIAGYVLAFCIVAALAFFYARWVGELTIREAGAAVFATTCGNAVFLGLPVALAIPEWGPPFLALMIFEGTIVFATGSILMSWPENNGATVRIRENIFASLKKALQNPIVVSAFLGLIFSLWNITFPASVTAAFNLFGGIASPMGLFVLGLYLYLLPKQQMRMPTQLLVGLLPIKLLAFPLLSAGLAYAFSQDTKLASVVAFFTLLPPAVSSVVMSVAYGQLEKETTAIVAIGSAVGLITTTLFLWLVL